MYCQRLKYVWPDAKRGMRLPAPGQTAGARVLWDDALDAVRRFYSEDSGGNRIELVAALQRHRREKRFRGSAFLRRSNTPL